MVQLHKNLWFQLTIKMACLLHEKLAALLPLSLQKLLQGLGLLVSRGFGTGFRTHLRGSAGAGFLLKQKSLFKKP
jgi:hypothetical protein